MWRALRFLWTASCGYRLAPWKSPYLRWRIETYRGVEAASIGAREFWRFCVEHRGELWRFLKWASRLR